MAKVLIWDEVSPINGIDAEVILANRPDLVRAHGDIFLVIDNYGKVSEIQIGSIIAANYGMEPGMNLQAIADAYIIKREEENSAAEEEMLTNAELQEQIAQLSYQVMMLEANNRTE